MIPCFAAVGTESVPEVSTCTGPSLSNQYGGGSFLLPSFSSLPAARWHRLPPRNASRESMSKVRKRSWCSARRCLRPARDSATCFSMDDGAAPPRRRGTSRCITSWRRLRGPTSKCFVASASGSCPRWTSARVAGTQPDGLLLPVRLFRQLRDLVQDQAHRRSKQLLIFLPQSRRSHLLAQGGLGAPEVASDGSCGAEVRLNGEPGH